MIWLRARRATARGRSEPAGCACTQLPDCGLEDRCGAPASFGPCCRSQIRDTSARDQRCCTPRRRSRRRADPVRDRDARVPSPTTVTSRNPVLRGRESRRARDEGRGRLDGVEGEVVEPDRLGGPQEPGQPAPAAKGKDWKGKGQAVFSSLTATASTSQAGLVVLGARGRRSRASGSSTRCE